MSRLAGSASDYVQGGGGNTSCKVDDTLMAIKASGFRLDQIGRDQAYAVLDYQALRRFYLETDPGTLADIEQDVADTQKISRPGGPEIAGFALPLFLPGPQGDGSHLIARIQKKAGGSRAVDTS